MILVVGGTGRLGRRVVDELLVSGHDVRVMSRGLSDTSGIDPRVEKVTGDVRDEASVDRAMSGVTAVVSAVQGLVGAGRVSPASVDRDGNTLLVAAAARLGAHLVLVSVADAAPDAPTELGRMKAAAEAALRGSPATGTVVRPSVFAETWVELLERSAGGSGRPVVLGRGDNPIPWVSVTDVAALVVMAVTDPTLEGRCLDIVGPERLTLHELALGVMASRGWAGRPRRVPRAALWAASLSVGLLVPRVRRLSRMALAMDDLELPDDRATRRLAAGLPATPVSDVLGSSAPVNASTPRA